ncbi:MULTISPECIES: DddA-like double-stranded DNA deaminase toxin [Pseudonocardiaceae]|uniref:DddA-like double-stranded DNA deaminase toxin n=1 Tax=Pseudonocardiaceae TaxID=2070 RepID=UPI00130528FB|nr:MULTISPECIES: DddA-like double-stranded DNA deaminase toxin [Pseudonocardiaceae]
MGYRAKLDNPWPYGRPLQGWRLGDTGEQGDQELASGTTLTSGQIDPAYTAAVQRARELGLARGGFVPDIARHIEIKQASTMSAGETRSIVIGKDPCGIDPVTNVSCHRFLRYFLPPDATLIVYGPQGEPYRYEGKRTS